MACEGCSGRGAEFDAVCCLREVVFRESAQWDLSRVRIVPFEIILEFKRNPPSDSRLHALNIALARAPRSSTVCLQGTPLLTHKIVKPCSFHVAEAFKPNRNFPATLSRLSQNFDQKASPNPIRVTHHPPSLRIPSIQPRPHWREDPMTKVQCNRELLIQDLPKAPD